MVFERFRTVLDEGTIDHRVQHMVEVLMQVRNDKYKDNPILPEGLDLVEAENVLRTPTEIKAPCTDMFSLDNAKNTRLSINYFTISDLLVAHQPESPKFDTSRRPPSKIDSGRGRLLKLKLHPRPLCRRPP